MKKISLLLVVLFTYAGMVNAQEVIFGAKGGLNVSNLVSDNNSGSEDDFGFDDPSTKLGFHAGLTGDLKISNSFGLGAELLYSQQGTKTEGTIAGQDTESTFKLDYINIPILAKVYLGSDFNIYGGIQPGFVANAKQINKIGDNETEYDLKNEGNNENAFAVVKDTDFSIPLGIGYRSANGLSFDARYNLGTTAVFENQNDESDNSLKNRVLQVGIGFNF